MKTAVIGIGSNSVRMLLAEIEGRRGIRLARERAGTRLFAGLDEQRNLSAESMAAAAGAAAAMAAHAREAGAEELHLFATSATRDASNAAELTSLLQTMVQTELTICTGEQEAELSYCGAAEAGHCGVIDIGGGSTEVIIGRDGVPQVSVSCQMGAVRLFREYPVRGTGDMAAVVAAADRILEERQPLLAAGGRPPLWTGTGGTFTTLAAMLRRVPWSDRTRTHGTVLPLSWVEIEAERLAGMTLEERLQEPGLQPNRADIVVHGICILIACMRRLGMDSIRVSEAGNLDGWVKRYYRLDELVNPEQG